MRALFCLLLLLPLIGCQSGGGESQTETVANRSEQPATVIPDMDVALATRNVSCGCVLEEVGHCGDYIEIEGRYVAISNWEEMGLGGMEWCGQSGVRAESAGRIEEGVFVATTLVTKQPNED